MNPHLHRGMILLEQSRYELAEDELRQALGQNPDDALAHATLAICLAHLEKIEEATREVRTAIHLAPDDSHVHWAHSIVLEKQNHYPEAQKAIEEAIRLSPYDPNYFAQLSQLQFAQRRWRESLSAAEQGLELDAESVACTNLRAMALVKLGKKMEAQDAIGSALQRAPEDAYSHANMGWSLIEQGQSQRAMEHFREALRLNPEMEWARIGIIEAMKSRYFVYRIVLNWFLWMTKLSGRMQWGVIFGAFLGYQFLNQLAATNPTLRPWITPVLVAYVTFAVMTWVASPLFNLALRLNRFGRLALSAEEIRTSNWVGLCVVGAIAFLVTYFVTDVNSFLACALATGLMIPLVAHIYNCSLGWPRATITLLVIGLGGLAIVVVVSAIAGYFATGTMAVLAHAIEGLSYLVFLVGAIASQFLVNFLVSARPRHRSTLAVWLVGGSLLGVIALLGAAAVALMVFAVWYEESGGLDLFKLPIRSKLIAENDLVWRNEVDVRKATDELTSRNFVRIGDYVFEGVDDVKVRYLLHEDESIVAELTELPNSKFAVALSTLYADEHVLSYGNGPADPLAIQPRVTKKRFEESALQLYERMRQERPQDGIRTLTKDEVLQISEQLYASDIDFLLQRGGPTASELRALGDAQGANISDATIARLQALWRRQATSKVDEHVLKNFLDKNPQFANHAADRFLCVHDLLTEEKLLEYCNRSTRRGDRENDELAELAEQGTPREAFSQMASLVGDIKQVGQTNVPIPTDIYLLED